MINYRSNKPPAQSPVGFYGVAVLGTLGGTLLTTGVFFYTRHRLGWGLEQNFHLAVAQGCVYVFGALLAANIVARIPPRRALALVHCGMAAAAAVGAVIASCSPGAARGIIGPLLAYSFLSAIAWPILEGMVSTGGLDALRLSRRLTTYNLIWSATMAAVLAIDGMLIQCGPAVVLAVPAGAHALAAAWVFFGFSESSVSERAVVLAVEPEVLRVRTVALWTLRLAMPAAYVVIFGLMPMMPFLPVMQSMGPRAQTIVSSTWPAARWGAFAAFALGSWWHRRPRILLAAAWLMLLAFLAVTFRPSSLWTGPRLSLSFDLAWMVGAQALLGISLGVIYSGSLYFGMVLSDGSTKHGGYHEALIGTGWVLGPAAGAIAAWASPGGVGAGVAAIGIVIALSVVATTVASIIAGARGPVEAEQRV